MIFYFSGTGNSYCVAKKIATATDERMINIAEAWRKGEFSYTIKEGERMGFIYPIHAWAPPTLVKRFIKKLKLTYGKEVYVYSVLTCGDDWEGAVEHIRSSLKHIGLTLQGDFKVIMPNDYVIGHELDGPELEQKKLTASKETIKVIAQQICNKKINYQVGKYSFYKSYIVYMLFQCSKIITLFHTSDQCVGCGLCEKVCPMKVIRMKQKKGHNVPTWGRGCVQCNACINACPKKAINYLGITNKRMRYFNSDYKKDLLSVC